MPGGTTITNTAQAAPAAFQASLDWNQEIPLEDKVNDHQIKSRAREIYTRIKAGVKNADEADKILNQFSEQLDRSSGWFAKGCLRLTYSDDLRRDLVIKRKYGIQILWQDDRNHEFYVAMYALLQIKGVDKQVLDQIHQPGRATISQMRRIMQEVKQKNLLDDPSFQETKANIEIILKYYNSYTSIINPLLETKGSIDALLKNPSDKIFLRPYQKGQFALFKDQSFTGHYDKSSGYITRRHQKSIQSLNLGFLLQNPEARQGMHEQALEIKNQIDTLSESYLTLCQEIYKISQDSLDSVDCSVLQDKVRRMGAIMSQMHESHQKAEVFLLKYETPR